MPAASLIVFRHGPHGPELLMAERATAMAFAGGALVFPGGRVEPGDHALAAGHDGDAEELAGQIAAIRETLEEAGLPIGIRPMPDLATLAGLRAALVAGTSFGIALEAAGLTIAPTLVPFARWQPDKEVRRYDTRFFLAELPADAPPPSPDGGETVRLLWSTPADLLAAAAAGQARVVFPTRRLLERLAQFGSYAEAAADADRPPAIITPWIEQRDGVPFLCIPEGLGYPVTSEPLQTARRG